MRIREYKVKLSTKDKAMEELKQENATAQEKLETSETEKFGFITQLQEALNSVSELKQDVCVSMDIDSIRIERDELRNDKKILSDSIEALIAEIDYHKDMQQKLCEEVQVLHN